MNNLIKVFCKEFQLEYNAIDHDWLKEKLQAIANSCPKERSLLSSMEELPQQVTSNVSTDSQTVIQAYSDGACSGVSNNGGWGAVVYYSDGKIETLSGAEANTTNNRMELLGAIKVLEYLKDKGLQLPITLTTDSQYVKNGITQWIFNWRKNGWKTANKEPVKNKDLWQQLDILNQDLRPQWQWVRGHNGNIYNEMCDDLAVKARNSLD